MRSMLVSDYNDCVNQCADGLYRFIVGHTKDSEMARDIVQDSFEKLWLRLDLVQAEKAKSYLFTTAYHTMIDQLRKAERQVTLAAETLARAKWDEYPYSDLNELLHKALEILPEVQRSVVLLRDYEGYSYQEIGEITGLTEAQVKVYIFRARSALKNYLVKIDCIL